MLRDLDENTWVLDPPDGPDRKNLEYTYRRVAISKGVSLQIDLKLEDCAHQLPSLKFLGSEDKIRPLRELLGQNIEKYDSDYTLVQNLEMVLELEFPHQQHVEEQEDLNLECAICYSYRLADQFPTENCDDPSGCGKSYHQMCLFEWLRSLPEQCSKMSFRSIFGQCPYCEKQISCKLAS
jgi:E3 ubiquitin-protein ligase FANCL